MTLFWTSNQAMNTTAAPVGVTTGTAIKTMLQIQPPSTQGINVVAFGVEFFSVLTASVAVELVDTVSVAATVTAAVAAGVQPYSAASIGGTSAMTLSTTATGFTSTSEGSVTATRMGKFKEVPVGAAEYEWEWSLGREFFVPASHNLRVRMTTATAVNALCWVLWDE